MTYISITKNEDNTYAIKCNGNVETTASVFMAYHIALEHMNEKEQTVIYDPDYENLVTIFITPRKKFTYDVQMVFDADEKEFTMIQQSWDDMIRLIYENTKGKRVVILKNEPDEIDRERPPVVEMKIHEIGHEIYHIVDTMLVETGKHDSDLDYVHKLHERFVELTNILKNRDD